LEARRLNGAVSLRVGRFLQRAGGQTQAGRCGEKRSGNEQLTLHRRSPALPPCHPLLYTLSMVLLSRVQVTARIDGDGADGQKLSGQASAAAEIAHFGERVALQHDDLLVVTVGDIHVSLPRIVRTGEVPHRSPRR